MGAPCPARSTEGDDPGRDHQRRHPSEVKRHKKPAGEVSCSPLAPSITDKLLKGRSGPAAGEGGDYPCCGRARLQAGLCANGPPSQSCEFGLREQSAMAASAALPECSCPPAPCAPVLLSQHKSRCPERSGRSLRHAYRRIPTPHLAGDESFFDGCDGRARKPVESPRP